MIAASPSANMEAEAVAYKARYALGIVESYAVPAMMPPITISGTEQQNEQIAQSGLAGLAVALACDAGPRLFSVGFAGN